MFVCWLSASKGKLNQFRLSIFFLRWKYKFWICPSDTIEIYLRILRNDVERLFYLQSRLVLKSNSRSIGCSLWIFNSIISVVMDIARKKIRLSYWINEDYYFETNKLHKFVKDIVNIGFYSISGRNYMKLKFHWISIYTGFFSWYLIKDFLIQEKMGKWKLFDRWKWILLISYQHCYTQNENWNKYQLL